MKKPWENAKCGYCNGLGNIRIVDGTKFPIKVYNEACPKCSSIEEKKKKVKESMVGYVSGWVSMWYQEEWDNKVVDEIRCCKIYKHKGTIINKGFRPIKARITIEEI